MPTPNFINKKIPKVYTLEIFLLISLKFLLH